MAFLCHLNQAPIAHKLSALWFQSFEVTGAMLPEDETHTDEEKHGQADMLKEMIALEHWLPGTGFKKSSEVSAFGRRLRDLGKELFEAGKLGDQKQDPKAKSKLKVFDDLNLKFEAIESRFERRMKDKIDFQDVLEEITKRRY